MHPNQTPQSMAPPQGRRECSLPGVISSGSRANCLRNGPSCSVATWTTPSCPCPSRRDLHLLVSDRKAVALTATSREGLLSHRNAGYHQEKLRWHLEAYLHPTSATPVRSSVCLMGSVDLLTRRGCHAGCREGFVGSPCERSPVVSVAHRASPTHRQRWPKQMTWMARAPQNHLGLCALHIPCGASA